MEVDALSSGDTFRDMVPIITWNAPPSASVWPMKRQFTKVESIPENGGSMAKRRINSVDGHQKE